MEWIAWIVLGGFAGWIAGILTGNNARMCLIANAEEDRLTKI